jgi:hypothetical protein
MKGYQVDVLPRNVLAGGILAAALFASPALAYQNSVIYSGQGLTVDDFGGYDLTTELCGVENGADTDGPYLLWVLTATRSLNGDITGPWGTAQTSKIGGGTHKYISEWYDPDTLFGNVTGTYDGKKTNAQLVVSHGCRPFVEPGAWCSPGFWGHVLPAGWAAVAIDPMTTLFNISVKPTFWNGTDFAANPSLFVVLTANGGTYKQAPVAGTDPRTIAPDGEPLNAFNATGAWLTDQIPGYQFDPAVMLAGGDDACPMDHHGNIKQP